MSKKRSPRPYNKGLGWTSVNNIHDAAKSRDNRKVKLGSVPPNDDVEGNNGDIMIIGSLPNRFYYLKTPEGWVDLYTLGENTPTIEGDYYMEDKYNAFNDILRNRIYMKSDDELIEVVYPKGNKGEGKKSKKGSKGSKGEETDEETESDVTVISGETSEEEEEEENSTANVRKILKTNDNTNYITTISPTLHVPRKKKKTVSRSRRHIRRIQEGTISNSAIRKLARKAGIKRIDKEVYKTVYNIALEYLNKLIDPIIVYTENSRRKTVQIEDVENGCKSIGRTLYTDV